MTVEIVFRYISALAFIALVLLALTWAVRTLGRGRLLANAQNKLLSVVESTYLTQQSTLHVIKVGERFFVVGGGAAGITLISELPAESVNEWIDRQRQVAKAQTESITTLLQRLGVRR